jgi:monomeric isocitrate dehydrogenase
VMNRKALRAFFAAQIDAAKKDGILFSLHVKTVSRLTDVGIQDEAAFRHLVATLASEPEFYAARHPRAEVYCCDRGIIVVTDDRTLCFHGPSNTISPSRSKKWVAPGKKSRSSGWAAMGLW